MLYPVGPQPVIARQDRARNQLIAPHRWWFRANRHCGRNPHQQPWCKWYTLHEHLWFHAEWLIIIDYKKRLPHHIPWQGSLKLWHTSAEPARVKSGEEWVKSDQELFTPQNAHKHWGFRRKGEEWRVFPYPLLTTIIQAFTLTVPIEQPTSECMASQLFFIRQYTISD